MELSSSSNFAEIHNMCEQEKIEMVDVVFTDVPGTAQHLTIPMSEFQESVMRDGIGFDGSSIRGFQSIVESDMVLIPVLSTAIIDPFAIVPTLSVIAEPMDPNHNHPEEYPMNPRRIARHAMTYLQHLDIADTMFVGPEVEFFIFDDVRYTSEGHTSHYAIDSREGHWNNGTIYPEGNSGHRPRFQEGYFPLPPTDSGMNLRTAMVRTLQKIGIRVECQHHEVAGPGQAEIDIRYQSMVMQADNVMRYKYVVKNVAAQSGKTVTFMPKPIYGQNGSGMHTHQSLWKNGTNLFYDSAGYAGLSDIALYYIGGILKHARAILAFAAPTTNSYKRLTPGYEAPVVLQYSKRNRSAAVRIPMYNQNPDAKRIEFRSPDPLANPYLAFSAMLMAGLDGIQQKIHPGDPNDRNLFDLSSEDYRTLPFVPSSLEEALIALRDDHDFLTKDHVFTEEFIENYIVYKQEREVDAVRLRPHPHEFMLYYNG